PLGCLDQQSGFRPQRPWWRDQLPDEGRLQLTAPNSMPQAAPTAASGAPCNTVYVTGNGGSIWQQKALRMTAGATSRHRGWRVSMAISAGRGPMPKFIWSLPQQTISSA